MSLVWHQQDFFNWKWSLLQPYWLSNKMLVLMISLDIDKIKFSICFIATI